MPSGFEIVQSTLLKIDGFKLNIDYVESFNKKFNIIFIEISENILNIQVETLFCFF